MGVILAGWGVLVAGRTEEEMERLDSGCRRQNLDAPRIPTGYLVGEGA
jgi:hypothetical protein